MPLIKLQSSEGDIHVVEMEVAMKSVTIARMLRDVGMDYDIDDPVPLVYVTTPTLKKVIEWCTYYKDSPTLLEDDFTQLEYKENSSPPQDKDLEFCAWDTEFLKVSEGTLRDLIQAADYLNIQGLLEVASKKVASMLKDKSAEKIRKQFDIENDFTREEEERIRKENSVVMDDNPVTL